MGNLSLQMHGYDMGGPGGMPPQSQILPPQMPPNHHPDSTDSYVTYLESDDSMQASP